MTANPVIKGAGAFSAFGDEDGYGYGSGLGYGYGTGKK
jgi:hypothetical protein